MRAVLCVDVEPDLRMPDPNGVVDWIGAERLVERHDWLRSGIGGQKLNWFVRFDHQIEHLHGDIRWPADRFGSDLQRFVGFGDEIGVHPHNWRWTAHGWVPDGSSSWVVENAARSIDTYASVFGSGPPSFRYGDRFVSEEVVRLLLDHPDVRVDLTTEPGVAACRGLVEAEGATGITRHVDQGLARRYRPDPDAVDMQAAAGDLTMVPLTVAAVVGTGVIDTLTLWRPPAEFDRMLRVRLLDRQLDHLAFAIRTDLFLYPWAIEHLETNLDTLARTVVDLEWVTASSLALGSCETSDQGLGPVGALAVEIDEAIRVVHTDDSIVVQPLADTVRSIVARADDLAVQGAAAAEALQAAEHAVAVREAGAKRSAEEAAFERRRADDLADRLAAIEQTMLWRARTRSLPMLRPVAKMRHAVMRRWQR